MSAFWDGSGGALIGAAGSGLIATVAIIRTRRDSRDLMREERSVEAAYQCSRFASSVSRKITPFVIKHEPNPVVDWGSVRAFAAEAEELGDEAMAFRSVIRPQRIEEHLSYLWDELHQAAETLPTIASNRDRDGLDDVARTTLSWCTSLLDELQFYLRADLERRALARVPLWRRYRLQRRLWPVRRVRAFDVRKPDEDGLAAPDY